MKPENKKPENKYIKIDGRLVPVKDGRLGNKEELIYNYISSSENAVTQKQISTYLNTTGPGVNPVLRKLVKSNKIGRTWVNGKYYYGKVISK